MRDRRAHLIVFSKDRPLQLHGMLTSVSRYWKGDFRVDVLLRATPEYLPAYREVGDCFPGVAFLPEADFPGDLVALVGRSCEFGPFTCFGTDDVVYTAPVDLDTVDEAFSAEPHLLGYSFRLGKHIERDMFGRPMAQPDFDREGAPAFEEYAPGQKEPGLLWDVRDATGDWGYPWEVLGTVYETSVVRQLVADLVQQGRVHNPSTLEDAGWHRLGVMAGGRTKLRAAARSRLVVPTVNVVQSVFGNGIVGAAGMDPAFLLDCWNRGLRLDVERYRGMAPPSWRIGDLYLRRAG